jgi:HEAT repeat protein
VVEAGLADPDAPVRVSAARLAAAIEAHGAAPTLVRRLSDVDPTVREAAAAALARIADGSQHPVAGILSALTRPNAPTVGDREASDLGAALEAFVTPADAEPLARAFAIARGGALGAIGQGLAAAHAAAPITAPATINSLIAALADGGAAALGSADALARASAAGAAVPALARAFTDAEPMVRARLCPALAGAPGGDLWLAAVLTDPHQPNGVRAAAAWAARGLPRARPALEAAVQRGGDEDVAANARAALAFEGRNTTAFVGARLRGPDGEPEIARWVTVGVAGGPSVRAMTDSVGVARVVGLPDAPAVLQIAGLRPQAAP